MAMTELAATTAFSQIHKLPQAAYIDAVKWLPPLSPLSKLFAGALFDTDASTTSLQTFSFSDLSSPSLSSPHSLWNLPSGISSLASSGHIPILVAATLSGSLHVLSAGPSVLELLHAVDDKGFYEGPILGIDVADGAGVVSVGEDGRVNLVNFGRVGKSFRRVFDGEGLVGLNAVKWASPSEFVTGGYGFGLQWWDLRRPGGPVSQFKGNRSQGKSSGMVHSIDIHPSRKHTCLAGDISGTIFAWDL